MQKFENIACIADNTTKAKEALKLLSKHYDFVDINDQNNPPEIIVVLGGDGFMLRCLHRFMNLHIPLYGLNVGHIGFLLNAFSEYNLIERLNTAKISFMHPLRMSAVTLDDKEYKEIAINEVYLLRETKQAAKIRVLVDGAVCIEEMVCDGVIVATSAGSTAYNFSAGGPIIPLGSNMVALTPISPFRPRRWRGALLPNTTNIQLEIIDADKRPVNAVADFNEVKHVVSVNIREDHNKKIRILFDHGHSLEDRIVKEQFVQ